MRRRLRQTHARAAPARRALRVQSRGDLIRHRLHLPALPRPPSTARTPPVSSHRRPRARVEPSLDARRAKRVRVPARKPHRRAIDEPTDAARQRLVHAVDERARRAVDASDFFRRHLARERVTPRPRGRRRGRFRFRGRYRSTRSSHVGARARPIRGVDARDVRARARAASIDESE